MALVEFKNLPDTSTPLNAANLNNNFNYLLNMIYPVGSIYMSVNSTNPSTFFGGTWVRWGNGRVPVGVDTSQTEFNTVEKQSGTKTHKHLLPIGCEGGLDNVTVDSNGYNNGYEDRSASWKRVASASYNSNSNTVRELNSYEATTLQPYITCYMWKRTA